MNILSPKAEYGVGTRLDDESSAETFALYECVLPDGKPGILKIATDIANNGKLDREAYLLQTMREQAEAIEVRVQAESPGSGSLGYRHFFPVLIESFIADDQGGRRVNILDLSLNAEKLRDLVPLAHLRSRDRVRVDPKTSVWVMGRLLKLLGFTQMQGISTAISGENILINRDQHHVLVFDWSESVVASGSVLPDVAATEISRAAKEVILALGGDPETGLIPPDEQLEGDGYQDILTALATGRIQDADQAHAAFYKYVRSVWPSKFHPFRSYPLK